MFDIAAEIENLSIVTYPHPSLRHQAKPIRRVDVELRSIIARMFDLMYEHRGVGLAATQVNIPLRLFIVNPSGRRGEGQESVFINPIVSRPRGNDEDEEGCLSLPGIYGNVVRSKTIRVNAYDLAGNEVDQEFTGFEARIIQHETDHLNGMLFIDRLSEGALRELEDGISELVVDFESRQRTGAIPANELLAKRLGDLESRYC